MGQMPYALIFFRRVIHLLYKVGTKKELSMLGNKLPKYVSEKLLEYIDILNDAYGENRDYTKRGGYVLIVENSDDVLSIDTIFDYRSLLFEWVDRLGDDYIAVLYMLSDDYAIVLCLPVVITPDIILNEMRGDY